MLIPYFKAGLAGNEYCMLITAEPLSAKDAVEAFGAAIPGFQTFLEKGQMAILPYSEWYLKDGTFDADRVLAGWIERLDSAKRSGFEGLRLSGNTFWLEKDDWAAFTQYEEKVNTTIGNHRMIALCTYSLDKCDATEVIDVVRNHQFALAKREGKWHLIESTDRRLLEDRLKGIEERFTKLFTSMTEGVALHSLVFDTEHRPIDYVVTDVNPAYERITGIPRGRAVGMKASELYGTNAPPYLDVYAGVATTGAPTSFDVYFEPMRKHFSISVFSFGEGTFATVFRDVTAQKKFEDNLRNAKVKIEKERDILQAVMNGSKSTLLVYLDTKFRFIRVNDSYAQRCGYTTTELIGKNHFDLFPNQENEVIFRKVRDTGQPIEFHDKPFTYPDQPDVTYWDWRLEPIKDSVGKVQGLVLSLIETTERKRAEEVLRQREATERRLNQDLRRRTEDLASANKEIESFSYSVSHDLRAPLRSLAGFSQALLEDYPDRLDEQGKEYLVRIQQSANRMDELIEAMLRLSRSTRKELHIEEVNVSAVASAILTRLKQEDEGRRATTRVEPGLCVSGDKELITTMFENLLQNAWKFTKNKEKTVINVGSTKEQGEPVLFVKDNGAGFDMTYADKLFIPFQRLHSAREFPGIGIGLSTVQHIVHKHGGRIWAKAAPDKGATFFFTIPAPR